MQFLHTLGQMSKMIMMTYNTATRKPVNEFLLWCPKHIYCNIRKIVIFVNRELIAFNDKKITSSDKSNHEQQHKKRTNDSYRVRGFTSYKIRSVIIPIT